MAGAAAHPTSDPPIVVDVVRQHAELAAFLWAQRDTLAINAPADAEVIAKIDARLEANLDGLRIAGQAAWPLIVQQQMDFAEKGELFVFAWAAIEYWQADRLGHAVELGRAADDDARGLVGALAWHSAKRIGPLVRDWIGTHDAFKRFLAVSACMDHEVDPKEALARLVRDPDTRVRAASMRLAGTLKRADLTEAIRGGLEDVDDRARFWAAWALSEMGKGEEGAAELRKVAAARGVDHLTALRAAIVTAPQTEVRAWMGSLLKSSDTAELAVRGSGMLGDRQILHWLIRQMRTPALAQAAGIAFLELFPEAKDEDKLFSVETGLLGPAFAEHFDDDPPYLPVADAVKDWAKMRMLLAAQD